jgi:hypothetical protein
MGFRQKDALKAWDIAKVKAGELDPREDVDAIDAFAAAANGFAGGLGYAALRLDAGHDPNLGHRIAESISYR